MKCNQYQTQMSLCLDGRLPAGSRAQVLAHIASCHGCARTWEALQQAQEIVLDLPVHRTSRDFRAALWSRIESGEGAPEIDLHPPVTAWTKVRYLISGAAAAAALLFASKFVFGRTEEGVKPESEQRIADLVRRPEPPGSAAPNPGLQFGPAAFAPDQVARVAANTAVDSARALRDTLCELESDQATPLAQRRIDRSVEKFQVAAGMLRWLQREGFIGMLPPDLEADLRVAERTAEVVQAERDPRTRRVALRSIEQVRLERLPSKLFVQASPDSHDFLREFRMHLERDPRVQRVFVMGTGLPDNTGQFSGIFLPADDFSSHVLIQVERRR